MQETRNQWILEVLCYYGFWIWNSL